MKKIIFLLFILTTTFSLSKGQFTKIGGGLNFGSGFHYNNTKAPAMEEVLHRGPLAGLFIKGIIEINLPVHISPSFTFMIPRVNSYGSGTATTRTRVSAMMFDVNGHYVFNSLDKFEFYGLAGVNLTLTRLTWLSSNTHSPVDAPIGFNIGGGAYMKLTEQLDLNAEFKGIICKYPQVMVNAGILLNLDWLSKNENK
jgi:opacity protein-like surface antigen